MDTISPTASTAPLIIRPPPPFPAPPRSVDLSALEFILGIVAVIAIPALIYTFFFAVKCPPDPLRRHRRHHRQTSSSSDNPPEISDPPAPAAAATSEVKYSKDTHGKGECPVCLSAFAEGDEIKKMSACDHAFHCACIDPWLSSHANCPVCRASVAVNVNDNKNQPSGGVSGSGSGGNNSNNRGLSRSRNDDLHQGLPDAANLV